MPDLILCNTEVARKYGDAWIENQVREASFET